MQDRPVCFQCDKKIETNAELVFEAPCGHDGCSSAVFHPICLFDWRDRLVKIKDLVQRMRETWMREHGEHEHEETE